MLECTVTNLFHALDKLAGNELNDKSALQLRDSIGDVRKGGKPMVI
jgi:hypothetical protein